MSALKNRVALVTGGSGAIGAATAKALALRGARVALGARTLSDLERVAEKIKTDGGEAVAIVCDVTLASQVDKMIARVLQDWGQLDILVNNAGRASIPKPVEEIAPDDWDSSLVLNLKSAFLCTRAVVPVMKKQAYGRIINVSSSAGRNVGRLTGPQYGAGKAGLIGFTRHMAVELGPYGICVNAIAPGIVLTKRAKAMFESLKEERKQQVLANIPLRRLAQPKEIAAVIAFLASDGASYVNGVSLDVNGGSYMA